jgi:hypothetical protein
MPPEHSIPIHLVPHATLEKVAYARKKEAACAISRTAIHAGDIVYAFKSKNFNDIKPNYAHAKVGENDEAFARNIHDFFTRNYSIEQMLMFHPGDHNTRLRELISDYAQGLDFIQYPLKYALPHPYFYRWPNDEYPTLDQAYDLLMRHLPPHIQRDKQLDAALKAELAQQIHTMGNYRFWQEGFRKIIDAKEAELTQRQTTFRAGSALAVAAAWIKTPRHQWLARDWPTLTNDCKILLSLTDIPWFAQQVEQEMSMGQWPQLLKRLFNPKFSADDFRFCIEWSRQHSHALPIIASAIYAYDLQFFSHTIYRDFTDYSMDDNATRLLYLFIEQPHHIPLLERFIATEVLANEIYSIGLHWQLCHYYRAAIFHHLLNGRTERAGSLIQQMPMKVKYHFKGCPKTHIKQTTAWARNW